MLNSSHIGTKNAVKVDVPLKINSNYSWCTSFRIAPRAMQI